MCSILAIAVHAIAHKKHTAIQTGQASTAPLSGDVTVFPAVVASVQERSQVVYHVPSSGGLDVIQRLGGVHRCRAVVGRLAFRATGRLICASSPYPFLTYRPECNGSAAICLMLFVLFLSVAYGGSWIS